MKSTAAAPKADPNAAASKIDLTWAVEGQSVWVMLPEDDPSGEACLKGTIAKLIDDDNAQVLVDGAKEPKNYRGDKIYPLNNYKDYPDGYDDMVDMENLSEAELLNNLRIRFLQDMIYTYVGPTLIVANPYKRIDKLLLPEILSNYQKRLLAGNFEQKENMPHVYAISATAMRNMFENYKNQAIVISGESGAGKTENTKSAMKFLTSLGKSEADVNASNTENIEDKILACNPILEAFGNAKTVRNDNSSRFGKYVALLVDKGNRKIVGATITNYLLEKSRVVGQVSEERNYHIFYAFLKGAPEELLKKYFVTSNLDDWEYTKKAFKGEVKTVPDLDLYKEVTDSFATMKFSDAEIDAIWTYTAAALMVGNLDFDESSFNDTTPCKIKNDHILKNAVKILNIDYDQFAKAIRFRTRVVAGSAIDSTMKREECLVIRDSLAKELYNKMFNWLVKRLNYTVMPSEFTQGGLDTAALLNKYFHIGLLDIFGFEIFNFNSIEQFCINFANEKLQQLYIAYVFKGEEKEFINEGLKEFLGELNFKDNQGLLDILDHAKLPGIFQMVDESCTVATTDQALYDKIVKQFKKPEFPFATPKMARDTFIIKHTAKEVEYNINSLCTEHINIDFL